VATLLARSTVRMVDGIVDELEETRILARTEKVGCYSRRLKGMSIQNSPK